MYSKCGIFEQLLSHMEMVDKCVCSDVACTCLWRSTCAVNVTGIVASLENGHDNEAKVLSLIKVSSSFRTRSIFVLQLVHGLGLIGQD